VYALYGLTIAERDPAEHSNRRWFTLDVETMKLKLGCGDFAFPLLPHDRVPHLIAVQNQMKSCPCAPRAAKQQQANPYQHSL
jgi:hypothetical protein